MALYRGSNFRSSQGSGYQARAALKAELEEERLLVLPRLEAVEDLGFRVEDLGFCF